MKKIEKFIMPPFVKFGDPDYLLADKINEIIDVINPSDRIEPSRHLKGERLEEFEKAYNLKPGVRITKNGKYYMEGKGFIKKEDAFI